MLKLTISAISTQRCSLFHILAIQLQTNLSLYLLNKTMPKLLLIWGYKFLQL